MRTRRDVVMAAAAMLLWVVLGEMVATTMEIMPMEEVGTVATTVAMAALLQATTATVAMEAMLLAVSSLDSVIPVGGFV